MCTYTHAHIMFINLSLSLSRIFDCGFFQRGILQCINDAVDVNSSSVHRSSFTWSIRDSIVCPMGFINQFFFFFSSIFLRWRLSQSFQFCTRKHIQTHMYAYSTDRSFKVVNEHFVCLSFYSLLFYSALSIIIVVFF